MKRNELEHVLRASAAITLENSFVVIGSQAVLLEFPDAPAELLLSNEVDLYPALHPRGLLRHGMITIDRLVERLNQLEAARHLPATLIAWARRRAQEAQA